MASPAMNLQNLPLTSDGQVKMMAPDGTQRAVHPEDMQAAMKFRNYRLPTAAELGGPSSGGPQNAPGGNVAPSPARTSQAGPTAAPPASSPAAVPTDPGPVFGRGSLTFHGGSAGHNMAENILIGAAKGGGTSAANLTKMIAQGLHKVGLPDMYPDDAYAADMARINPQGGEQKIGKVAEQAGEFAIPGLAAGKLTKAGLAARMILNTVGSGAVNKMQGGSFTGGALSGAAGGAIGEGVAAGGKALISSVLPGADTATVKAVGGLQPSSIAANADAAAVKATAALESQVGHSGTVDMKPTIKAIDDSMKKALMANDDKTVQSLRSLRQAVTNTTAPNQALPSEALGIHSTLRAAARANPAPADALSYHPSRTATKAASTLLDTLDTQAPGAKDMANTISKLVSTGDAAKAAKAADPNALGTLAKRAVLDLVLGGSAGVGTHNPLLGLGVAAAAHAASTPTGRMAIGRSATSVVTPAALDAIRGALMQFAH